MDRSSALVALGILCSRIIGLVRNRVFAHYFGTSTAADAFNAAFRIPNFLQNLFGEGVLSASLIPVYAGLRAGGRTREAAAVDGGGVAPRLLVALLVLAGVLAALVDRCDRAGLRGREARAHRATGADSLPGGGPARAVRLVPGGAQQPSPLLPLLRGTGGVERRHHRRTGDVRQPPLSPTWPSSRHGDPSWAACCSCCCSCPRCSGCSTGCGRGLFWAGLPRGASELRSGVRRPRRRADQRLRGHAARQPAADRRGGRGLLCPGAVHAPSESLRDVGLRRGTAGDVERDRHGEERAAHEAAWSRGCGRSPFS